MSCDNSDRISRLKRFDLPVPVKFRASGEQEWHAALARNVSASGALVIGENRMPVGAEVEVWLLMHTGRDRVADVVCPSVVVRCEKRDAAEERFGIAMKFQTYEFRRAQA